MAYDPQKMYYRFDEQLSRLVLDYHASRQIDDDSRRLYKELPPQDYDEDLYATHHVKRGLRNRDGSGVVSGLTRISNVHGYNKIDGVAYPDEGRLTIRGYNIDDLITSVQAEDRFGFEELSYLLITGALPKQNQLDDFCQRIGAFRHISNDYLAQFPITTVSSSIMNVLQRSVLLLYAFDSKPDSTSPEHEIDVALSLMARLPRIAAYAYQSHEARREGETTRIPVPKSELSSAETILDILRGPGNYTRDEAKMLDVMLMLHAEHGGGNNSTFTCRVLSSSGTDAYSAYSAAIGSLKGPLHGGANMKVTAMHKDIREHVQDWGNEDEVAAYLTKILRREAFDNKGLIYGMGHAVYTLSDPRAVICKRYAKSLAEEKGMYEEYHLIETIEELTPQLMRDVRGSTKPICANIDLYSGFIYKMLGIPETLYTPLFAVARMAGWAAHRMEELYGARRIIRPAYVSIVDNLEYLPISER